MRTINIPQIIREIAKAARMDTPHPSPLDLFEAVLLGPLFCAAGLPEDSDKPEIIYSPAIVTVPGFTAYVISGIIAHEMGHIHLGHITWGDRRLIAPAKLRAAELDADLFAANIGYGPQLVESFRIMQKFQDQGLVPDQSQPHSTHPPLAERIRAVEAAYVPA